ncbi:hypothetical protein FHL15_005513 [Xylaria flabelliformis]|uniref:Xylanolytic transcriptional activator regulatory domain-containing protein n=1 Tax=Xylaria flabelliformis TaxID=2512241 RepID=A0A553I024_9PEZI|nr:hypothetical protein FHL15_005513 [Xylaria flabelliformis]
MLSARLAIIVDEGKAAVMETRHVQLAERTLSHVYTKLTRRDAVPEGQIRLRDATRIASEASHSAHTKITDDQLSETLTAISGLNDKDIATGNAVVRVPDPGREVTPSNTARQTTGSGEEIFRDASRQRILFRSENSNFESSANEAWARFNNAYIQLPQIIALGPDILAIEAMITMALFTRMTADACTSAQLVSSAVKMYQMTALQNDPTRTLTLGASDDRHRRAFWTAYILDWEISTQFGLPPAIDGDEFDVGPLRQETIASMEGLSPACKVISEIAILKSVIYKRLYQRKAFEQPDGELITNITEINWGLDYWLRSQVSADFRPDLDNPTALSNPSMETLLIHFFYYLCVDMAHWAVRRHGLRIDQPNSTSPNRFESERITMLMEMSRKAARATLRLLLAVPMKSFMSLWRILCYPISACITLLTGVLANPLSVSAKSDVSILGSFRQFLESMVLENGFDLQRTLQGCMQMEHLAQNAVDTAEAMSATTTTTDGKEENTRTVSWDEVGYRQAQKVGDLLASCTHPIYVAQGLMTNMKTRDSVATEALSEILSIHERGSRPSSLFVPECLWPKINGFSF